MGTQVPRPELARNTIFNWIPQAQSLDIASFSQGKAPPITLSPVPFVNPVLQNLELDTEPWVAFVDSPDSVVGHIHFQQHRFPPGVMERFGRNYELLLHALLQDPQRRVNEIESHLNSQVNRLLRSQGVRIIAGRGWCKGRPMQISR